MFDVIASIPGQNPDGLMPPDVEAFSVSISYLSLCFTAAQEMHFLFLTTTLKILQGKDGDVSKLPDNGSDFDSMEKKMDIMETKISELYLEKIHEEREHLASIRKQKLGETDKLNREVMQHLQDAESSRSPRYCIIIFFLLIAFSCKPKRINSVTSCSIDSTPCKRRCLS